MGGKKEKEYYYDNNCHIYRQQKKPQPILMTGWGDCLEM
jgi:hypothetical protein